MPCHFLSFFPSLLLLRVLFLLPSLLFVLRPSSNHPSTSSSSTCTTIDALSSPTFFANALPISMLNSMTRVYPMHSVINRRRAAEHRKTDHFNETKKKQKTQGEKHSDNFGRLKLCPPGGRSFFEAFELACPMKRRRRKRHAMFGFGRAPALSFGRPMAVEHGDFKENSERSTAGGGYEEAAEQRRTVYRPANITELMQICCTTGCEFTDLLPHCGPFSI